jgi:peptide/nickel transport system ATP-binding protein
MNRTRETLLQIDGLSVDYGAKPSAVHAVRNVSFSVSKGEAFGLIGESGSGKTTIAFSVMRYLEGGRVVDGRIVLNGQDVLTLDDAALGATRGKTAAMVYQDPLSALNPIMPIGAQVAEGLIRHRGMSKSSALAETVRLLDRVNLPDPATLVGRYPHQLSGGQQQRVVIAMALACQPDLLIMDEPTTGLDVTTEAVILDLIAGLRKELGVSILFISHNLGVVAKVCDRVGVLYAGELMEVGSVDEVLRRPKHPYTRALIGAVPKLERRGLQLAALSGQPPDLRSTVAGCSFAPRCPDAAAICATPPPVKRFADGALSRCHFGPKPSALAAATATFDTAAADDTVLRVEGLYKSFNVPGGGSLFSRAATVAALQDVSLALRRGETLAVVGESGSGKSTLARCIAGLITPDAGSISLGTERLSGGRTLAQRRHIQIIFQNPEAALNPLHTIEEIISRPLKLYGLRQGAAIRSRVVELLDMVKLGERYLQSYPRELSGGQKQRVSIARAFAAEPEIVICDEPTSALDISVQAALLNELKALQAALGLSYIFISHDLGVVNTIADRIAVMYLGRVVESGLVADVFSPPHHPYTEALISAVPTIDPDSHQAVLRLAGSPPRATSDIAGCVFHSRCPRKLGEVCETVKPPQRGSASGHVYECHITDERLADLQADRLGMPRPREAAV